MMYLNKKIKNISVTCIDLKNYIHLYYSGGMLEFLYELIKFNTVPRKGDFLNIENIYFLYMYLFVDKKIKLWNIFKIFRYITL